MTETRVRFVSETRGVLSLVEVETDARPALFGVLTRLLFDLRIQIVRAESQKLGRRRRKDQLWVVELDGAPIGHARRLEIQVDVLRAVEQAARPPATPVQHPQTTETKGYFDSEGVVSLEA